MFSGLSFVFVTTFFATTGLAFQGPAQNGFRPIDKNVSPPSPNLSPERRGDILMARKMYREAIDTYREGPRDSAVIANKIGIAYHQLMELDAAKKQYERAIKLNPQYAEAINNLGTVFYARKSYRRAINEYKKALHIDPQSASFVSNLGTAYFARRKYKDAVEQYQLALKLDPEVFERRSNFGTTLEEHTVEERAKLHYLWAKTYAKAGDYDHALQYVRKALEEGFKDRQKFRTDPEFAKLQDNQEFKQLLATEQKVL
jgi:tetratricopeptide (TPR) repeat protein